MTRAAKKAVCERLRKARERVMDALAELLPDGEPADDVAVDESEIIAALGAIENALHDALRRRGGA